MFLFDEWQIELTIKSHIHIRNECMDFCYCISMNNLN